MKKYIVAIGIAVFLSIPQIGTASDFGGGGTIKDMQRAFKLNNRDLNALRNSSDDEEAFWNWVNSLDHKKRQQVLEKVFRFHIMPQLN